MSGQRSNARSDATVRWRVVPLPSLRPAGVFPLARLAPAVVHG